jgi:hypothetical protein
MDLQCVAEVACRSLINEVGGMYGAFARIAECMDRIRQPLKLAICELGNE